MSGGRLWSPSFFVTSFNVLAQTVEECVGSSGGSTACTPILTGEGHSLAFGSDDTRMAGALVGALIGALGVLGKTVSDGDAGVAVS